jgi:hypothetical protein
MIDDRIQSKSKSYCQGTIVAYINDAPNGSGFVVQNYNVTNHIFHDHIIEKLFFLYIQDHHHSPM